MFYNEAESQIARDAQTLKVCRCWVCLDIWIYNQTQTLLETEWRKRPFLPAPRSSPPPSSAQKVHQAEETAVEEKPAPVPVQSRSTAGPLNPTPMPRQSTPDVDVEIMSPDSDGGGEDDNPMPVDRDPLSEEIARNLERGLPRWAGFHELGWLEYAPPERLIDLVQAIKSHKDVVCVIFPHGDCCD